MHLARDIQAPAAGRVLSATHPRLGRHGELGDLPGLSHSQWDSFHMRRSHGRGGGDACACRQPSRTVDRTAGAQFEGRRLQKVPARLGFVPLYWTGCGRSAAVAQFVGSSMLASCTRRWLNALCCETRRLVVAAARRTSAAVGERASNLPSMRACGDMTTTTSRRVELAALAAL